MANRWHGEFYQRQEDGSWRNRRTGTILGNVRVKKRKGMRNQAIFWDGKNWKGVEPTKAHFFGSDPKKNISAEKAFKKRILTRQQQKAMFAKKGRK